MKTDTSGNPVIILGDPYGGFIEQPDFGEAPEVEDEETTLAKYHELIKGVQDTKEKEKESKGKGMELEITWDPGKAFES